MPPMECVPRTAEEAWKSDYSERLHCFAGLNIRPYADDGSSARYS